MNTPFLLMKSKAFRFIKCLVQYFKKKKENSFQQCDPFLNGINAIAIIAEKCKKKKLCQIQQKIANP